MKRLLGWLAGGLMAASAVLLVAAPVHGESGEMVNVEVTGTCVEAECPYGPTVAYFAAEWPSFLTARDLKGSWPYEMSGYLFLPTSQAEGLTLTADEDLELWAFDAANPNGHWLLDLPAGVPVMLTDLESGAWFSVESYNNAGRTLIVESATGGTTTTSTTTTTAPTTTTSTTTTTTTAPTTTTSMTTTTTEPEPEAVDYGNFEPCEVGPLTVEEWAACSSAYNVDKQRQTVTTALLILVMLGTASWLTAVTRR